MLKKFVAFVLSVTVAVGMFWVSVPQESYAYMDVLAMQQLDTAWCNEMFGALSFGATGCGIMSYRKRDKVSYRKYDRSA